MARLLGGTSVAILPGSTGSFAGHLETGARLRFRSEVLATLRGDQEARTTTGDALLLPDGAYLTIKAGSTAQNVLTGESVTLAAGSVVWLDAGSLIRPVVKREGDEEASGVGIGTIAALAAGGGLLALLIWAITSD